MADTTSGARRNLCAPRSAIFFLPLRQCAIVPPRSAPPLLGGRRGGQARPFAYSTPPGVAGTAQHGGEHGAAEEGAAEEGGEEGGHGTTEGGEELTGVHGGIGDTILPPGGMFCVVLIICSLLFAFCFSKYLEKSPKMSRGYAQPSGDETASLTKGGAAPIE